MTKEELKIEVAAWATIVALVVFLFSVYSG